MAISFLELPSGEELGVLGLVWVRVQPFAFRVHVQGIDVVGGDGGRAVAAAVSGCQRRAGWRWGCLTSLVGQIALPVGLIDSGWCLCLYDRLWLALWNETHSGLESIDRVDVFEVFGIHAVEGD